MKIIDIEGVGPVYADKLQAAGVSTTEALLARGGSRKGRQELAAATGLSAEQILEWVNRSDLMRINGIGSEYSDLLEQAGVDTVAELAQRNAANLSAAIQALVGDSTRIVRRVPSDSEVASWVDQAKKLPRAVEY